MVGKPWRVGDGFIECGGYNNYLYADRSLGAGDFRVKARLTILKLAKSAASFTFENNIVYWGEGPLMSGRWKEVKVKMDKNCYWNSSGKKVKPVERGPRSPLTDAG